MGTAFVIGIAASSFSARAAEQAPTGGQLLHEMPAPAAPPVQPPPAILVIRPQAGAAAQGESFMVQNIDISGGTLLPPEALHAVVASSEGKLLTLADLQRLADEITALYQKSGFPYAHAYVPAQTLEDGRIRITVVEARYDSVVLRNTSGVHDSVPNVVLRQLRIGAPVDQATLDRVLLLVSDLPGTLVKGTLRPGKTAGASELLVDVDSGPAVYGKVSADDYGTAATGRPRANASVSIANPLHQGDLLSLSALTAGRGLNYGRVGYSLPVYGPATQVTAEASALSYRVVNGSAVNLDARGTADVAGGGVKQVLYRSTNANLYAHVLFDETLLRDHAAQIRSDRHTDDWHATVFGALTDTLGATNVNLGITQGHVRFDDAAAQSIDAAGPKTSGQFTKYVFDISRLQHLTENTALYGAYDLQRAGANLDPSEQFFVGGPNSVRAYDNGVASGTQGDSVTIELRRDVLSQWPGAWQAGLFLDAAHVEVAKLRYAPGPNNATLSGTGLSLNWMDLHGWSVNSSLATPIGGTATLAGRRDSVRVWALVQKAF